MAIVYQKSKGLTDAELHYCPGCNHGIVHKLVAEVLEEMGLLDDRKTAAQIVERCIARGYGINRARQALYEKKIPQRYWEEVLSDYPDQQEKIIAFLQSRLSVNPDGKERKRAVDALMRRGYKWSEIRGAMAAMRIEECGEDYDG